MAVLNSNELKVGTVFNDEGDIYVVQKYQHIKKGRGQATIRVKVKNIRSGSITEKTYTNEQKVEAADVEKRNCQYLYKDGDQLIFMDNVDFSQHQLPESEFDIELNYLLEGQKVVATFLEGELVTFELPKVLEFKVIETSNAVAGNTSSGATKSATIETGYELQVPLFVNFDDVLKVNTETGEYVSKA